MSEAELDAWVASEQWEPLTEEEAADFRNLRVPMVAISLRLPEQLLADVKAVAEARGQRYQPLLRHLIEVGLSSDVGGASSTPVTELRLSRTQLRELRSRGELTVHIRAS
ncbi:MAG: BrnA antitoxin family protein [Candidatus Dormibacteraeota bacterium]|nr:BrnA antitoxin family protein [Candidatus Dormibacteraeota bacterium]